MYINKMCSLFAYQDIKSNKICILLNVLFVKVKKFKLNNKTVYTSFFMFQNNLMSALNFKLQLHVIDTTDYEKTCFSNKMNYK